MNARLLPDYGQTLTVAHRWLIVSLGIIVGLLASACADPHSSTDTPASESASRVVLALLQGYQS